MRNLKRVLSLALASVMLLGMMVIGAGAADKTAADLTDSDKIVNKDAVNLMVDLGIIVGKPDGSYAPTETVDRATMAKLIYSVLEASTDASAFTGVSSSLKDVKGNWAEGYINYCYSLGIVAGTGDNTFNPNGKVSVVSAAKMLLVSLGYDSKLSKYENDPNWSVNIMKDAQKAGLLVNISQKTNEELTRDNAAQMIYNTMNAKTVEAETERDQGVEYLKKYNSNATTLGYETYGLIKVTGTVSSITSGKATFTATNPVLALTFVNNKIPATAEAVGKNVTVYVKGVVDNNGNPTKVEKLISSTLAVGDSNVLATVTDGIASLVNATTSGHKDFVAEVEMGTANPDIFSYVNGDRKTAPNGTTGTAFDSIVAGAAAKKGAVVEFIDTNANGKADIIKVTDKTVATLTGDPSTKTVDGKVQVKVPGITALANFNSANTTKNVFGYEDLKEDDVVLYYKDADSNYYIEKADMINGKLTATKGTTDLIIDSKTYKVSGLANAVAFSDVTAVGYNLSVNYYLDNGGFIVEAVAAEEAAKAQVAIITGWTNRGAYGDDIIEAKFLMADGTTETGTIAKISATLGGAKADADAANAGTILGTQNTTINVPVTYTLDKDGDYQVAKIAGTGDYTVATLTNAAIANNKANFSGSLTGNNKTAFLIKDGSKVQLLEGILNAPKYDAGTDGADGVAIVNKDGMTTIVYITAGKNLGTSTTVDRAYIIDNTSRTYYPAITNVSDAYFAYDAIVAGEPDTIKVLEGSLAEKKINANTIYALTLNKDKLVTDAVATVDVTNETKWSVGVKYMDGVVRVGDAAPYAFYTYEDDSKIYVIDGDSVSVVKASDLSSDSIATVLFVAKSTTANTVIKELYVIKNNVQLPATITVGGSATLSTNKDLLAGPVSVTGGTAGTSNVTVTPAARTGFTYEVKISGAGTAVTDAAYILVAGDSGKTVQVSVKVTEDATGATQTLKYQIPVATLS
jgi:hypothetical protein